MPLTIEQTVQSHYGTPSHENNKARFILWMVQGKLADRRSREIMLEGVASEIKERKWLLEQLDKPGKCRCCRRKRCQSCSADRSLRTDLVREVRRLTHIYRAGQKATSYDERGEVHYQPRFVAWLRSKKLPDDCPKDRLPSIHGFAQWIRKHVALFEWGRAHSEPEAFTKYLFEQAEIEAKRQ